MMPVTSQPYLKMAVLVTARMTAFRPGASPPPERTPMRMETSNKIREGKKEGTQEDKKQGFFLRSPFPTLVLSKPVPAAPCRPPGDLPSTASAGMPALRNQASSSWYQAGCSAGPGRTASVADRERHAERKGPG